ncbi:peptidase M12 [Rhodocytophaga rosea]|uniref:Peptidase M12 n=1 Tax=Rhodocytophaga rosea TaxID=2704465 RepID=A0A6C0GEK7_9BACT|nr:M12 family metallopeptidase [Rhodocytophaga rosea]QHT66415.1 peptidase M12 [Rhodocytophaga rosea]
MRAKFLPSLIWLFAATAFLYSCQKEDILLTPAATQPETFQVEEAFSGETGKIEEGILFGTPISYSKIGNQMVFQGDILLTQEQLSVNETPGAANGRTQGTGRSLQEYRWSNKIVYYTIDPDLPNQQRVKDAITHWQANSPIKFVLRTTQPDFVTFTTGSGCSSYVGKLGGEQYVFLALSCTTGNVIHEIGHTVGLWHEQTRVDRGKYIKILWNNISEGYEQNFSTYTELGSDGFDHGTLDFGSIMMYPSNAFSMNGKPTITKLDGSTFTAQRNALSAGDIAIIKVMYPVPVTTSTDLWNQYKAYIANKTIKGTGTGKKAEDNLKKFISMLDNARKQLDKKNTTAACAQLTNAQKHIHTGGKLKPDHFITGTNAGKVYELINQVKKKIGCK